MVGKSQEGVREGKGREESRKGWEVKTKNEEGKRWEESRREGERRIEKGSGEKNQEGNGRKESRREGIEVLGKNQEGKVLVLGREEK